MSNIYKLQRYVNGSWVDVQLGQMNSVPVTQDAEDTPSDESEGATTTNTGTTLEQYLTLSQIQDQFVSTAVVRGNLLKQTLEHGLSAALGYYSVAFGDVATVGKGSAAFGGDLDENLEQIQVPGYWYVNRPENPEDWTEVFYMSIADLDDVVTSTISTLEKLIIRATVERRNYYLVITQVQPYQDEYYQFTFSQSQGDWEVFKTIIDGLVDDPNATHPSVNAQFTFIRQVARGNNSFIAGKNNITLGDYSSAFGQGLHTTANAQTVVGKYNAFSDDLLVVGNGASYSRKNAFAVTKNNAIKINDKTVTAPLNSGRMLVSVFKSFTETIDAYIGRSGSDPDYIKERTAYSASSGWYFINYGVTGDSYLEVCDPIYTLVPCFPDSMHEPWEITMTWRSPYTSAGSYAKIDIKITWDNQEGFVIKRSIGRGNNGGDKEMIDVQHTCYFSYTGVPMTIDTQFIGHSAYTPPYDNPEVGIK